MKLYLTLEDDDGQKVERVIQYEGRYEINSQFIVESMYDTLLKSKKPL